MHDPQLTPLENPEKQPVRLLAVRLTQPMIDQIKELASTEGVTIARCVQWLLSTGIDAYKRAAEGE